jgi:hypothetical protein
LVEGATALLPATRRANVDLAQTLSIAQRLAILDPMQGIEGAAFAIRELLSGEYLSLSRRFEMSRTELQALVQAAGDDTQAIIEGLDQMVNEMGLTDEAMMDMGQSGMYAFEQLKSEIQETVAMGFAPMLQNGVLPLVSGFSDLISQARDLNPELAELTMTMVGFAAAAQAAQMAGIPGAGRIGIAGGALYGGVQAGLAISRGLAETGVIDNPELENVSQEQAGNVIWETAKQAMVIFVDGLITAAGGLRALATIAGNIFEGAKMVVALGAQGLYVGFLEIKDALYDFRDAVVDDIIPSLKEGVASFLQGITGVLEDIPGMGGIAEKLESAIEKLVPTERTGATARALFGNMPGWEPAEKPKSPAEIRKEQDDARQAQIDAAKDAADEFARQLGELSIGLSDKQREDLEEWGEQVRTGILLPLAHGLGVLEEEGEGAAEAVTNSADAFRAHAQAIRDNAAAFFQARSFTEEQIAAFAKFQDDLAQIEADAQKQREDALKQHEKTKTRAEEDFARKRQRDVEDENRRYQQAVADLEGNIADERIDANERIADLQENFQREEVQRAEDYARERQQRLKDLALGIAQAARKLDASAIWDLLQRNKEEATTNKEAYDRETQERKQELNESVQQTRQASAARIAAMRDDFAQQEALRAEERAIRLQRENEDFALQMQQMDAQHAERLATIDRQAQEQTAKLEAAFINTYNQMAQDAGQHQSRMIDIQRQGQNAIEVEFANWLRRMQGQVGGTTTRQPSSTFGQAEWKRVKRAFSFDTGGRVPASGMYSLSRGEQVLTPGTAEMMRNMLGGEINSPALMGAMSGGSRSVSVGDISIPISITEPGASADQIGNVVEYKIRQIFEDFVNA